MHERTIQAMKKAMKLYLVTDGTWSTDETFYSHVEEALKGGVTCLQLREKQASREVFIRRALKVKDLAQKYDVPFLINDNIEVAQAVDADGVHIGQGDISTEEARRRLGQEKIIGVTCKTLAQATQAEREGADYIGSGAAFGSKTKTDTNKLDHRILKEICESVTIPVVAIGGINEKNVMDLIGTQASGIAVVSSILAKKDKTQAARELACLSENLIRHEIPRVLTIAGSDCSGGAGIQADLKTIAAHACYGMSVITALTAQNTTGVYGVETCSSEFVKSQMDCIFTDIVPQAIKIGMVSSKSIITALAEGLGALQSQEAPIHLVLDPVMVSTSGSKLLDDDAMTSLKEKLMPLATLITPNLSEAELLSGLSIRNEADMLHAARAISTYYKGAVLVKGGHLSEGANDLLFENGEGHWFGGEKIDNPNTHGTGCTLSSAIASNLAKGYSLKTSIENSKTYLTGAIKDGMDIGRGRGPLNHMYRR